MNRKRSQLQAYFAGLFDGEGHVGIRYDVKNYNSYTLQIVIQMNDPQGLLLLAKEYPEAHTRAVKNASGTIGFALQYSQHKAYTFLSEILPFLIVKHDQAQVALSFISHRRRDHQERRTGDGNCLRCHNYMLKLKAIRAEDKRVNSVNALLDHGLREYRSKPEEVTNDVAEISAKVLSLLEGLETRLSRVNGDKAISALEKDIVHTAA